MSVFLDFEDYFKEEFADNDSDDFEYGEARNAAPSI